MQLPINTLKKLDKMVDRMYKDDHLTDREIAIREIARALISATHDEYYNNTDPYDKSYSVIADTCRIFVEG